MTDQMPPAGHYQPSSLPDYSSAPTPVHGFPPQMSGPVAGTVPGTYTPWLTRVLAWLVDMLAPALLAAIGVVFFFAEASREVTECLTDTSEFQFGEICATGDQGATAAAWVVLLICAALSTTFQIWNFGYRQGTTGSSIGKTVAKFQVVSEKTWRPVGFGLSIVRQLAHIVDGAVCYIGYLFPLWDAKRQTIADKLMGTVCVPL